jgi:hypothetical protein
MTKHLRDSFGWSGLLLDSSHEDASINLHQEFVSAENIVELFFKYRVPQNFDFLSVDIDGNDYWVLRPILENYRPKFWVAEYNQFFAPEESYSISYDPQYCWEPSTLFFGASLGCFFELARAHQYSLVSCLDQNAFFVADEFVSELQQEIEFFVNEPEFQYQPRIPRCYRHKKTDEEREFLKEEVESPSAKTEILPHWTPMVDRCLFKPHSKGGVWVTPSLSRQNGLM